MTVLGLYRYSFEAGAGAITTSASVLVSSGSVRASLDLVLILYSTDGSTVLFTADPSTCSSSTSCGGATTATMGASLSYTLPDAGKYYIAVPSTGANDLLRWVTALMEA